jgi:predicted lipoprotein with Yx(FWY)xxD motif
MLSGAAAMAQDAALQTADKEPFGSYLTDADGKSLYLFTSDAGTESSCYDNCATNWPPLTGEVKAGSGIDATLIGMTQRTDGTSQVTYNGHPLYYYAKDMGPGDTTGQDVGEKWYLVSPAGEEIEAE